MRRRLTVAMTLMVAVSLALAGVVTLLLTVRDTRIQTRHELVTQAKGLAKGLHSDVVVSEDRGLAPGQRLKDLLLILTAPLRLNGEAVLVVTNQGGLVDLAAPNRAPTLPSGLTTSQIDPSALLAGRTVQGSRGDLVWAAVPFTGPLRYRTLAGTVSGPATEVVVLTRRPPTGLAAAGPWFLVVAAVIIALALLVANRLGHRIVRPLEAARAVTERIAGGDLEARVPNPPGTDPELAALSQSVNAMAAGLARSRGLERQFLMSVSHELRTPLTSIRGFAEAIADGAADDTERAAEVIAAESRRLERLVRDLLELARLDARQFSLDMRPVDLGEVVADTAEGFRPMADDLGLALAIEADPLGSAGLVQADPDRLAQVVANLVENALKFAGTGIRVAAALSDGVPVLWVDDDGPGIPAGDLSRVFDRLYTSGRRPDRPVGSGLGLAIVAELVAAMDGVVRADSPITANGGTRLVVTLRPAGVS